VPKLMLIRHGQSINNAGETVQGSDPDPGNVLSEKGIRQALALGDMLLSQHITPAGVWSSPLVRARQTCDIVLKIMGCDLPVQEDLRLSEMCKGRRGLPGGLEGRNRNEVKTPAYRQGFKDQGWHFRHGSLESGGETAKEAGERFFGAMEDIADGLPDDQTGLVFAHGQASRFGAGVALGFPPMDEMDATYRLANCEGLVMARDAGQWQFLGRIAAA
jgi:broad specificity phosphatase PhoE